MLEVEKVFDLSLPSQTYEKGLTWYPYASSSLIK